MDSSEKEYTLTTSLQQMRLIQVALNFYSRSFLGQLELWHLPLDYGQREEVEMVLKKHLLPKDLKSLGYSLGIHCREVPDEARKGFDIHDVIRHELWKDSRVDSSAFSYVVASYPPTHYHKDVELPVFTIKRRSNG